MWLVVFLVLVSVTCLSLILWCSLTLSLSLFPFVSNESWLFLSCPVALHSCLGIEREKKKKKEIERKREQSRGRGRCFTVRSFNYSRREREFLAHFFFLSSLSLFLTSTYQCIIESETKYSERKSLKKKKLNSWHREKAREKNKEGKRKRQEKRKRKRRKLENAFFQTLNLWLKLISDIS